MGKLRMNNELLEDLAEDGFGHWIAGFIDGEGCFVITCDKRRMRARAPYSCRFEISVRDDDADVLKEIARRTGLGHMAWCKQSGSAGTRPKASWRVMSRRDCLGLVALLDRFPLRAKKARDFEVWRTAVHEWLRPHARGEYGRMPALKLQLHAVREYPAERLDQQMQPIGPTEMQLPLAL